MIPDAEKDPSHNGGESHWLITGRPVKIVYEIINKHNLIRSECSADEDCLFLKGKHCPIMDDIIAECSKNLLLPDQVSRLQDLIPQVVEIKKNKSKKRGSPLFLKNGFKAIVREADILQKPALQQNASNAPKSSQILDLIIQASELCTNDVARQLMFSAKLNLRKIGENPIEKFYLGILEKHFDKVFRDLPEVGKIIKPKLTDLVTQCSSREGEIIIRLKENALPQIEMILTNLPPSSIGDDRQMLITKSL